MGAGVCRFVNIFNEYYISENMKRLKSVYYKQSCVMLSCCLSLRNWVKICKPIKALFRSKHFAALKCIFVFFLGIEENHRTEAERRWQRHNSRLSMNFCINLYSICCSADGAN